jgi:hypothetical protein
LKLERGIDGRDALWKIGNQQLSFLENNQCASVLTAIFQLDVAAISMKRASILEGIFELPPIYVPSITKRY